MVRFLSDEWLAELDRAVAADDAVLRAAAGVDLTIQQVVVGDDGHERCYFTRVADGQVHLFPGRADDPDATITEDYTTAVELARGEMTPQDAILAGRVRVRGDMGALLKGQDVLERVRARFDTVRVRTTF